MADAVLCPDDELACAMAAFASCHMARKFRGIALYVKHARASHGLAIAQTIENHSYLHARGLLPKVHRAGWSPR